MFFTGNIKFGMVTKKRGSGNGKLEKVPVDK